MGNKWRGVILFIGLLLTIFSLFSYTAYAESTEQDIPKRFFVAPPPFSPGIFPCSQCHQGMPANRKPRKLVQFHENIVLKHMPDGWCFDCHNPNNRDKLRLANGKLISFEESYYLCAQCHGTVFRDWKIGLHGKRSGMWNGEKQYLLCVHCHWPHDPKFKPITPMPPPARPSEIK